MQPAAGGMQGSDLDCDSVTSSLSAVHDQIEISFEGFDQQAQHDATLRTRTPPLPTAQEVPNAGISDLDAGIAKILRKTSESHLTVLQKFVQNKGSAAGEELSVRDFQNGLREIVSGTPLDLAALAAGAS